MTMAPIAAAHKLIGRGVEPIVQFTGRDRNRIALEADMLAASALGVTNLLCMSGDPPGAGDHPDAVGVFDLRAETLLEAARKLNSGSDLYGNRLSGSPRLFAGAVANPGADDVERELARMEDKVRLGAAFFQTQGVYDPSAFESFMASAGKFGVPVLAGVIVLKSARMARYLNARLPGVNVPQPLIDEMEAARGSCCCRRRNRRQAHSRSPWNVPGRTRHDYRLGGPHSRDSGGGGAITLVPTFPHTGGRSSGEILD